MLNRERNARNSLCWTLLKQFNDRRKVICAADKHKKIRGTLAIQADQPAIYRVPGVKLSLRHEL